MTGTIRIVSQKTPKDVVEGGGYRRGLTVIYGIIWMDDSIYYAVPKLIFAFTTTGSVRDTSHIVRTCPRSLVCRPELISHSLACSKNYCLSVLLKWRMLIISSGTLSGSLQAKYQHIIIINFIIPRTRKKRGLDSGHSLAYTASRVYEWFVVFSRSSSRKLFRPHDGPLILVYKCIERLMLIQFFNQIPLCHFRRYASSSPQVTSGSRRNRLLWLMTQSLWRRRDRTRLPTPLRIFCGQKQRKEWC